MVWQQALYLVNLLCKFVPCDYTFGYPDTSISEPQAFKNLISLGFNDESKDHPDSLRIGDWERDQLAWIRNGPDYTKKDPLVVITKTGKLRGFWMKVVGGRKIRAFEGIPYSEKPTGYFRFSAPSPKISWTGLLHATRKGPKCLQYGQLELQRIVGNEDCLFLNIYSPQMNTGPGWRNTSKFPVLIYIHGGGFQVGSGNDFGPAYLLQQDLILVTFNWRVGIFGFLSTGDTVSPGNYGLKDQALAIKWVYENIEFFNGDNQKISLIGNEAGGASVHLQMISDKARPYFQAGISMSGTAFSHWVFHSKGDAKDLSKYFAKKFNCPIHSSEAIVSCLRRCDAVDLAKKQIKFLDDWPLPVYLFRPVIEDINQKEEPFLTETPDEVYKKNNVAKIAWISGFTEDEGLTFLLPAVFRGTIKQLRSHWNILAPDFLDYEHLDVDKDEITKKVNWLYFKQTEPLTAPIKTFSDALSIRFTVTGVHKGLQAHCQTSPTFGYMFAYNGKYNLATLAGIKPNEWGVGQGEDTFYLLNSTRLYQGFKKSDHELILSKIMVNLFGNFASKRFPTFTLENHEDFQIWDPITDPRNMSFLLIHKKIKMIPEPYLKQTVFWESMGLPDTIPLINSTDHYHEHHALTTTPATKASNVLYNPEIFDLREHFNTKPTRRPELILTTPVPQASYAISNPEVFDLRESLNTKPTQRSPDIIPKSIEFYEEKEVSTTTSPTTTTTTTPVPMSLQQSTTTTTSPTTVSKLDDDDFESIFLPPLLPTTTTSSSPPTLAFSNENDIPGADNFQPNKNNVHIKSSERENVQQMSDEEKLQTDKKKMHSPETENDTPAGEFEIIIPEIENNPPSTDDVVNSPEIETEIPSSKNNVTSSEIENNPLENDDFINTSPEIENDSPTVKNDLKDLEIEKESFGKYEIKSPEYTFLDINNAELENNPLGKYEINMPDKDPDFKGKDDTSNRENGNFEMDPKLIPPTLLLPVAISNDEPYNIM